MDALEPIRQALLVQLNLVTQILNVKFKLVVRACSILDVVVVIAASMDRFRPAVARSEFAHFFPLLFLNVVIRIKNL